MEPLKPVTRIAKLREDMGLTQRELSQLLQVTENTVANWENNRTGLEWIERVIKLCRLFECSPEDLIEYVPDENPTEPKLEKKGRRSLAELQRMLNTHPPALGVPGDRDYLGESGNRAMG
ncbi:helix-turn-helix domain protein [Thalassoporum mexicanum PCC 7367]|uniref:helix-turn-helix domain-containing protein n=1 Tax=Thalassoporum mexicanum TaxID=3457544 RepID=UPI00029FECB3|nr:helix-turn-helix transcriptional regulator [Pseudanabaena sp. PCC 7367]AFY69721.1 helix-turn-helix domain protein [Pseudanabaena sp. PCC 7367]